MSRARVLEEMERRDVDALILGREGNARYISGANRLSLAGTRAFAPGCVLVRRTGDVHLLSITDDGIPDDIPPANLYGITWNPMNLLGSIAAIPGVAEAKRVGVDGLTPLFDTLLRAVLPSAELVDGQEVMRAARTVKNDDEVAAIRAAIDVAEDAIGAAFAAGGAGAKGAFLERMALRNVTTPAFEPVVSEAGHTLSIDAGVLREGWEGTLGRTWPQGIRWDEVDEVIVRCRAGEVVGPTGGVEVGGAGLGYEPLDATQPLQAGMVLGVGVPGHREMVLVTDGAPEVLTRSPREGAQ